MPRGGAQEPGPRRPAEAGGEDGGGVLAPSAPGATRAGPRRRRSPPPSIAASSFLLEDQRPDGSWGSPERTKDLNIIAGIGSHHAFRVATTALCVSALIELTRGNGGADLSRPDEVRRAIERGEEFLLPRASPGPPRRSHADLQRLGPRLRDHGPGPDARPPARTTRPAGPGSRRLIRDQYDRLTRYESAEGGWGYYDFGAGTQRPNSDSASFVNAAVLVAFHEAKAHRRAAAGEGHAACHRGADRAAQAGFQLPLRPLSPLPADDGDQSAGRQPGAVAGLQPRPAALGRHARSPTRC